MRLLLPVALTAIIALAAFPAPHPLYALTAKTNPQPVANTNTNSNTTASTNSNANAGPCPDTGKLTLQVCALMEQKRDPYVAGIFSMVYCGTGQFYNGQFTKGSLLFLSETVYHLFNFGLLLKIQNSHAVTSITFDSLDVSEKVMLLSSFVFYLGLKVYSIYDAYVSSEIINSEIDGAIDETVGVNAGGGIPKIGLNAGPGGWELVCSARF